MTKARKPQTYQPWHGWLLLVVVAVALVLALVDGVRSWLGPDVPTSNVPEVMYEEVQEIGDETLALAPELTPVVSPESDPEPEPVAPVRTSFNLALPWLSQAPFGVCDAMHEETCEEASFVMVAAYYGGVQGDIDPADGDAQLFDLVAYEEANGYDVSMTAAESAEVVAGFYPGFAAAVVSDPTIAELKAFIDAGTPVIVPAAGRELGNPFFTGEGPVYHMLVLRGYTETTFITNDPGTRQGKNYTYDIDVFMDAIGDWEGHSPANGPKRVIVMTPL